MVNEDVADRIKAEVAAQLAKRGLGELQYEVCSWRDRLYFVFAKEIGHKNDSQLSAVARSVVSSFKEEIVAKISDYSEIDSDDDEEFDDEYVEEKGNAALQEITAAIEALPKFPIDVVLEKVFSFSYPVIEIGVGKQFWALSEEEVTMDRRDKEQERLEAMADDILFAEDDGEDAEGDFEWLPIPPPPKKMNTEVYLPMAYEPYDWIEKGEKTTEFREYCEYYVKKLLSQPLKTVRFQRGYGGPGHDAPRQMRWTVAKIEYYDIHSRQSAPITNPPAGFRPTHIAIDLGERIA
ncbi:MAG: hypothetical protein IKQ17_13415 [Kiritimatiellae bacterium]|nr:hypothetical protein [Kiritimatiellia bacterium]